MSTNNIYKRRPLLGLADVRSRLLTYYSNRCCTCCDFCCIACNFTCNCCGILPPKSIYH